MSNVHNINKADKALAKQLHNPTTSQLYEAEKLFYRSSMSWLACVKTVVGRSTCQTS